MPVTRVYLDGHGPAYRAAPAPPSGNVADWYPGADLSRLATVDGGSMLAMPPKACWHSTETLAVPAYGTGYWPHFTVNSATGRVYQHLPVSRAARALRNETGGVQTNRANCVQVEVTGYANALPYRPVMRDLARWLKEVRGVPLVAPVTFKPYPSSYGANGVRLSGGQWEAFTGHLGHMHVPENDHGDPGWPFPIDQILASEEDDVSLSDAEWDKLRGIVSAEVDQAVALVLRGDDTHPDHLRVIREELAAIHDLVSPKEPQP